MFGGNIATNTMNVSGNIANNTFNVELACPVEILKLILTMLTILFTENVATYTLNMELSCLVEILLFAQRLIAKLRLG